MNANQIKSFRALDISDSSDKLVAGARAYLATRFTEDIIDKLFDSALTLALGGDLRAMRLVFAYAFGLPSSSMQLREVEFSSKTQKPDVNKFSDMDIAKILRATNDRIKSPSTAYEQTESKGGTGFSQSDLVEDVSVRLAGPARINRHIESGGINGDLPPV